MLRHVSKQQAWNPVHNGAWLKYLMPTVDHLDLIKKTINLLLSNWTNIEEGTSHKTDAQSSTNNPGSGLVLPSSNIEATSRSITTGASLSIPSEAKRIHTNNVEEFATSDPRLASKEQIQYPPPSRRAVHVEEDGEEFVVWAYASTQLSSGPPSSDNGLVRDASGPIQSHATDSKAGNATVSPIPRLASRKLSILSQSEPSILPLSKRYPYLPHPDTSSDGTQEQPQNQISHGFTTSDGGIIRTARGRSSGGCAGSGGGGAGGCGGVCASATSRGCSSCWRRSRGRCAGAGGRGHGASGPWNRSKGDLGLFGCAIQDFEPVGADGGVQACGLDETGNVKGESVGHLIGGNEGGVLRGNSEVSGLLKQQNGVSMRAIASGWCRREVFGAGDGRVDGAVAPCCLDSHGSVDSNQVGLKVMQQLNSLGSSAVDILVDQHGNMSLGVGCRSGPEDRWWFENVFITSVSCLSLTIFSGRCVFSLSLSMTVPVLSLVELAVHSTARDESTLMGN